MPELYKHCEISMERTGKSFEDLHKWMDESYTYLKENHRSERHSLVYVKYIKEKWGEEGVIEFLNHIVEDYKCTLKKWEGGRGRCIYEGCNNTTYKESNYCRACWTKMQEVKQKRKQIEYINKKTKKSDVKKYICKFCGRPKRQKNNNCMACNIKLKNLREEFKDLYREIFDEPELEQQANILAEEKLMELNVFNREYRGKVK